MGLLRRRDYAAFWAWFARQAPGVRGPEDIDRALVADLGRRLMRVDRRLEFEIGLRPTTDELDLVISAGGRDKVAPVVLALVAAAPELPGWRVTAFRPPRDVAGTAVRVLEEIVAADEVWATVTGPYDALVVRAHVRDLDRDVHDRMRAAHLLVEQALGERTLVERVAAVEWISYRGDPPPGLTALPDLRAALPTPPG